MAYISNLAQRAVSKAKRAAKYWLSPPQPVYVFHHLPKCGGTSIRMALGSWFELVPDYAETWQKKIPPALDIRKLQSTQILCGHFDVPGYHLAERYPEVYLNRNIFRVFTFIRDPLQVKLSLYYYEKKNGLAEGRLLENELLRRSNYLAQRFPCGEDNYRQVIDRYFFVGILEEAQLAFDLLADAIRKRRLTLPNENTSSRDAQELTLSPDLISRFKEANQLDYAIYDYCQQKFNTRKPQGKPGLK